MINPKDLARRGFRARENSTAGWIVDWEIPADLRYFAGHFPILPTLPAVAMIDLTLELLPVLGEKRLSRLKSAKFSATLHPGMKVVISGKHDPSAPPGSEWHAEWRLEKGDLAASFIFGLVAEGDMNHAHRQNQV